MDTKIGNKLQFIWVILLLPLLSSCLEDNYDGPNANFHGTIIDVDTNEPVYSEQPNGFQIRFKEVSWGPDAQAQTFWGKYDGSFNWDYLFGYTDKKYENSPYDVATYEVEPFDGAFELVDEKKTIQVKPGASVEVSFKVKPYIRIQSSYELNDTTLTVKYSMDRSDTHESDRIGAAGVVMSSRTKYLSASLNAGGKEDKYTKMLSSLSLVSYKDGKEMTSVIELDRHKKYWMTVAAKINGSERWNYTKIVEIVIP